MAITSIDDYAYDLIEKSKQFYEKGKSESDENGKSAYFQASILFSVMSLETTISSIAGELCSRDAFSITEKSMLLEKEIVFHDGVFDLSAKLKMSRLVDKISLLLYRFHSRIDKRKTIWWSQLNAGIDIRNALMHPKDIPLITPTQVENTITSVLKCIDALYRCIYHRKYPHFNRSMVSIYAF